MKLASLVSVRLDEQVSKLGFHLLFLQLEQGLIYTIYVVMGGEEGVVYLSLFSRLWKSIFSFETVTFILGITASRTNLFCFVTTYTYLQDSLSPFYRDCRGPWRPKGNILTQLLSQICRISPLYFFWNARPRLFYSALGDQSSGADKFCGWCLTRLQGSLQL